jgi:hypothetical protein
MKNTAPIRKQILLNKDTDRMLREISNASYTNHSQKLRELIKNDYQNLRKQVNEVNQFKIA